MQCQARPCSLAREGGQPARCSKHVGGLRRPAARLKIRTDLRQPDRRNTREGMRSQFRGCQGWLVLFLVSDSDFHFLLGALSRSAQEWWSVPAAAGVERRVGDMQPPTCQISPHTPSFLLPPDRRGGRRKKKVWHCSCLLFRGGGGGARVVARTNGYAGGQMPGPTRGAVLS